MLKIIFLFQWNVDEEVQISGLCPGAQEAAAYIISYVSNMKLVDNTSVPDRT